MNRRCRTTSPSRAAETPPTAPPGMTREIFDNYADRFDAHLLGALQYRVPQRVAHLMRQRTPSLNIDVLDLGCGTGLIGAELGRVDGSLVGVDLSAKMLEKATMLGVYSDLKQADLLDALRQTPSGSLDYVTAADVFIYVGELSEVIPAAFACLRGGGALIFSCESANEAEGDLVLRASKRYAHSRTSIESLCRNAGFCRCSFDTIDLRPRKTTRRLPVSLPSPKKREASRPSRSQSAPGISLRYLCGDDQRRRRRHLQLAAVQRAARRPRVHRYRSGRKYLRVLAMLRHAESLLFQNGFDGGCSAVD